MSHGPTIGKPYRPRHTERDDPPFRCGFQPQGRPYREYVAHIRACGHLECRKRWVNNMALRRELLAKYGTPNGSPMLK